MKKEQAKAIIFQEIQCQSPIIPHYIFLENEEITTPSLMKDEWNLSFPVGKPLREVQLTLNFQKNWVDILAFPHPRIIEEEHVLEMVRFVNCLNSYVKLQNTNGRFYIDETDLDVAYSSRLSYKYLELLPQEAVSHGVLGFLSFVADAAAPLYCVGQGEMTAEGGCRYVVELWET